MASESAGYVWLDEIPRQSRCFVRVHGPDRLRFLQGILTQDITRAGPDRAVPAAILTVKGKLVSDAIVLVVEPETIGLALPSEQAESVRVLLDRHIVMDDVAVVMEPEWVFAFAWPNRSDMPGYSTVHPAPGRLLAGKRSTLEHALGGLLHRDVDSFAALRVHTGSPAWGHEIVPDRFPPEVGFVSAVSYGKGCYMGQEPLARIHARGQVNWVMVRVSSNRSMAASLALASETRADMGVVTTSVASDDAFEGLAIVRRAVAVPGTLLRAFEQGVTVTSGPLGDDPGSLSA